MSLGEVDTLNLLSDKLENLFNESQGYYESFLDANNLYKQGKLSDKEFFQKLGDYVVAYSALEFLAIKVILEFKKAMGAGMSGNTQSPGLMPGMGQPGMMAGGSSGLIPPNSVPNSVSPRGTTDNPVGAPPSVMSANSFGEPGTIPSPDPSLISKSSTLSHCSSCDAELRINAKFCTKCGVKTI